MRLTRRLAPRLLTVVFVLLAILGHGELVLSQQTSPAPSPTPPSGPSPSSPSPSSPSPSSPSPSSPSPSSPSPSSPSPSSPSPSSPSPGQESDQMIVVFSDISQTSGILEVEKRPGQALGLNLGVVKKGRNETLSQAIDRVTALPGVVYAESDDIVTASVVPNDPSFTRQWGMQKISAPAAWDITTGGSGNEAPIVCVIDTGIDYNHPDISPNMHPDPSLRIGWNAITNSPDCMDGNSHGTHCAGVIAASTQNSVGVAGINWNGRLLGCKFLDDNGSGYTSDAIECLNWCVTNGAKISSNSWGGGGYSTSLYNAINAAKGSGHLFVAAAGNAALNMDSTPDYPASYALDNIISVAASDSSDNLASFSNYGLMTTDIAAPGVDIYSTINGGGYASYSGTSMACPHVAGVAALVLAASNSSMSAYPAVRNTILQQADAEITGLNGKVANGARLNALKAVQDVTGGISSPPPVAPGPSPEAAPPVPSPPPPAGLSTIPVAVSSMPFVSGNMDISSGSSDPAIASFGLACPSFIADRLVSGSYKKMIFNLTGLPNNGTLRSKDCDMPNGIFDTVGAVIVCDPGLTNCACYANDDGCGYAAGDVVDGVPLSPGKEYYSVVMPYAASRTSGVFRLTIEDPNAGATPPPSGVIGLPSTSIEVNGTWPYVSQSLDIASGQTDPVPQEYLTKCAASFVEAMTSSTRLKKIVKISGLPSTGEVSLDNCAMPNQWDSISVVLDCADGTTNCECYANDDGCAYAGGDKVQGVALSSGREYYAITMPYSATLTSGVYSLTAVGTNFPSPPTQAPAPEPDVMVPTPSPDPQPVEAPVSAPVPDVVAPVPAPVPDVTITVPAPVPEVTAPAPAPVPDVMAPAPSPENLSPPSSPPPPVAFPFTELSLNGDSAVMSPIYNLISDGSYISIPYQIVRACPRFARTRLQRSDYRKHVVELTNMYDAMTRYQADACSQPNGRWNSINAILVCNSDVSSCSCSANNDGCGRGAGGKVSSNTFDPTKRYFFVSFGARTRDVGSFNVKLVGSPSSFPPPALATAPFPVTQISLNGGSDITSPTYSLVSDGSYMSMPNVFVSRCPRYAKNRMQTLYYRKHVLELTDISQSITSYRVDACSQPRGRWNSINAILVCNNELTSCSCSANNDGCGRGAGGKVSSNSFDPTRRYFFVSFGSRNRDSGSFNVKFSG